MKLGYLLSGIRYELKIWKINYEYEFVSDVS